jgi:hypothetical protein
MGERETPAYGERVRVREKERFLLIIKK